jgi:hypothetical protein
MAATVPNISKGRINEFVNRVNNNDPATSGFVVVLLQATGIETLAVLRDYDTLAAILAAANDELSVGGYARLVWTDADVGAPTVDDTGDQQTFDMPDDDFGALAAGQSVQGAVVCYAPDTTGADSTFIPCAITRADTAVPTNGEIFHLRSPSGLWAATE